MKLEWNSKRVWLTVAMSALAGVQLLAAPFDRVWNVKQPDGTVIQIHGKGDDFHADMEVGGYTIVFDLPTKSYMYATRSADGKLLSSGLVAGRDNPSSANLNQHVRADGAVVRAERQERFTRWDETTRNSTRWKTLKSATSKRLAPAAYSTTATGPVYSPPGNTTLGNKVGLCLLVDFSDDQATILQSQIDDFCNGDNYTEFGNNGSVKQYFLDVSNQRMCYTNIVTVYLRVPHPKTYYNDPVNTDAANELVKDALDVLKALPNYDTEIWPRLQTLTVSGGQAVACNVYYAGHPDVGWAQGLWPHSWGLYQVGAQTLGDGISVMNYQMTDIGDSLTLGTFCHENGHMLCGYPDIYDYDYDSTGGAGGFCLMDYGGSGGNPTKMCAYLRMHSGWLDVVDLETVTDFFLTLTTATTTIYKYTKPTAATEYYLFENRQQSGRDADIPGSGIAIWHCDELGDRDNQLYAYNATHQNYEVQLMQADNQWHLNKYANSGEQADLYYLGNPSASYSNEFADDTAPSSKWWNGSLSDLYVGSFSAPGESMTMSVIPLPPEIATTSPLPEGRVGSSYWAQFKTKAAYPSNVWSVVNVAMLPSGLTLDPSGLLSGVPTQAGTNTFDIVVQGRSPITTTNTFELVVLPCYTAPYSEGFNGAMEGELTGWHQECVSNAISWRMRIGSPSTHPPSAFEGVKNAYLGVFNDNGTASFSPHVTRLISPMIQFGPYAREVRISFAYYLEDWPPLDADILKVYYKTTWSDSWIGPIATYTANTVGWTQQSITLPESASVAGTGKGVYFAFEGSALGGHGISLDAIVIDDPVPPLHISTTTPLPIALCGTNYTLASPLVTLESVGGFTNALGLTNYQYAVVNGTSLPTGFILTPEGVITGRWNSVVAMTNFDVEVTDSVSGAKATNTLSFAVEYPRASVLAESFYGDNVLSSGWTMEYVANTVDWTIGRPGGKDGWSPPATAQSDLQYAVFFGTPGVGTVMCTKLISPVFDLTQMPNNTRLVFWHFMQQWEGQDELRVYYRNVQEGSWTKLATYTSNVTSWTQRTIPLPSPTRYYQIAFEGVAKSGYGVCVDTISITDDGGAPVILTRGVLPSGFDNFSYQTTLEAIGGSTPYRWTVVSNGLPRGLVLDPVTGIISGIPAGSTQTVFRVAVTGQDNKTATNTFSLNILPPGIVPYFESFATNALPQNWEQVTATGSQAAWEVSQGTYSFYESFPSNLKSPMSAYSNSLPNNVCLWAFPKDDGTANIASLITKPFDLGGCTNTTLSFQLCMKEYGSYQDILSVSYRSRETDAWTLLAVYETNTTVWTQQTLQLPNPSATYRLKFEGYALGGWGICIDDVDVRGEKSGSPLAIVTPTLLPGGTNHVAYPPVTLMATNGTLLPYTWRLVTSDVLPTGLTLDSNTGVISGTPTEYGFFTFGVTVQDANNVATTSNFNLRVYSGSMTPFEEWQATYFSTLGYLGDNVDQSGDGIPNLIKYGMGLNPTNKNLGIYILGGLTNLAGSLNVADGRYLYLGYRRSLTATDVNFFVKGTTNLADGAIGWLTNNIAEQTPWIVGETDVWSWVYSVHTTPVTNAPQRFLRLEVSTNLTTNIF
jgi:M6 family metalloprotease-like protein